MAKRINRDDITYKDGDVYIDGKLYGSEIDFENKIDAGAIQIVEPSMINNEKIKYTSVFNEEELRKYVREVLLKNTTQSNDDILPKSTKQEIEKEAMKIRSSLIGLLQNLENKEYSDIEAINKGIKYLTSWKTRVEKVLN